MNQLQVGDTCETHYGKGVIIAKIDCNDGGESLGGCAAKGEEKLIVALGGNGKSFATVALNPRFVVQVLPP